MNEMKKKKVKGKKCKHSYEVVGFYLYTKRWRCKKCGHEKPYKY